MLYMMEKFNKPVSLKAVINLIAGAIQSLKSHPEAPRAFSLQGSCRFLLIEKGN